MTLIRLAPLEQSHQGPHCWLRHLCTKAFWVITTTYQPVFEANGSRSTWESSLMEQFGMNYGHQASKDQSDLGLHCLQRKFSPKLFLVKVKIPTCICSRWIKRHFRILSDGQTSWKSTPWCCTAWTMNVARYRCNGRWNVSWKGFGWKCRKTIYLNSQASFKRKWFLLTVKGRLPPEVTYNFHF